MPDDNDGSNTETNGGGGYDTGNGGMGGFGLDGNSGSYGSFSQVDAATIAATLGSVAMMAASLNNPAVAATGMTVTGGIIASGALEQAITDMNNTNLSIGPGPDFQASSADPVAAAYDGQGVTDYFNAQGQIVGSTFDPTAYAQWMMPATGVG